MYKDETRNNMLDFALTKTNVYNLTNMFCACYQNYT